MDKELSAQLLDKAALICVTKHCGQRDKMGCSYFQHPMRVAMRCVTDEQKMVALLHDVIEDCDVTADNLLAEGFPPEVVEGVVSVTKNDGESYEDFVARAKQNPLGRIVKLHDLEDNLDVFRLDLISPEMAARYNKYLAAYRFLKSDESLTAEHQTESLQTFHDLYVMLRDNENKKINSRAKYTGGSDFMHNRLIIRDKDKLVINESSIFAILCALGRLVGFDKIESAGVVVRKGRECYKLIRSDDKSHCYTCDVPGRWVLSNAPVPSVALALNELFDKINERYIASIVDR